VNSVVQGAWAVLMSRYAGTGEVVFGVTSSGRGGQLAGMAEMVGLLITTTPLRVRVDEDVPVGRWLAGVQESGVRARAFEHTPLLDIQAATAVPAGQPLFTVLYAYENYPTQELTHGKRAAAAAGLRTTTNHTREQDHNPLGVIAGPAPGDTVAIRLVYDRAVFADTAIDQLAAHLLGLLEAIAADPEQRVGELPLLTPAERDQLVKDLNDTAAEGPAAGGIHDLITARSAITPDAVAVTSAGQHLTYAHLLDQAGRLAGVLREAGVGPESVVGLCLDRRPQMITAILAVWLAGGAYLPLDPTYPAARVAHMLTDSRAAVLVTTGDIADDLPVGRLRTIVLDEQAVQAALTAGPVAGPAAAHPAQLAYVIYTSGSTGTPKGVQVCHGGVVNLAAAQRDLFGLRAGDVVLGFAPFIFDASLWELTMTLAAGATLTLATADERTDPGQLTRMAAARNIQVATVPPSLLGAPTPPELAGVRTLVTAGERLDGRLASAWAASRDLVNAYGPTETTVCATTARIAPHAGTDPPIGNPIANTAIYVLDSRLRLAPAGVTGELYVGGAQLARGYARRPALTAERFIADPFAADGSRLYRTGDLARWTPAAELEFTGRADEQVKIRGYRVEPGEIEAALAAHPAITAAVVTAFGDDSDRRLAAYLVPADKTEGAPPAGELRDFLRRRLPEHMIPSVYTELASIPLTPSGKTDRTALPGPGQPSGAQAGQYVPPTTPTEELLAKIWGEILGISQVGIHHNLFDLGAHSLLVNKAAVRIQTEFGVEIPIATIFERPTIAQTAEVITKSTLGIDSGTEEYTELEI
jgi:amino acid adenylation domain-containing protein